MVGERCVRRGSPIERTGGAHTSENAGMSSEISVKTRYTECLRVPGHRQSTQGESGPKPRASSRRRWQAGGRLLHRSSTVTRGMGGRGREGEPLEWTGAVGPIGSVRPRQIPVSGKRDPVSESSQEGGSYWPPGRQEKPLPRGCCARTANRHW